MWQTNQLEGLAVAITVGVRITSSAPTLESVNYEKNRLLIWEAVSGQVVNSLVKSAQPVRPPCDGTVSSLGHAAR
jgi:hypothetical protein